MRKLLWLFSFLLLTVSLPSLYSLEKNQKKKAEPKEESTSALEKKAEPRPEDSIEEAPPPIGNFSLPGSQQPAALFGFGGNVLDKGEVQLFLFADAFSGCNKAIVDLLPNVVFGINDKWSILFGAPFTPALKDRKNRSNGLEDFFVELEYAFYNKATYCYTNQATLVTNVTVPTGSVHKNPQTGFGSPSLFLGTTFYHTRVHWFAFTAHAAVLTTRDHHIKFGNQFLYQFGLGRNFTSPEGWIYAWMVELDGQYNQKNRIHGHYDHSSGGNVLYLTPSLWLSSKEMLIQFGVSLPLNQNFFGSQRKVDYAFNFNFAWSFY